MRGGKYLVLCMKCTLSIPGNLTLRRRLTSLSRREQATNNFCCVYLSCNCSVFGAVPSAAGVDGHSGSSVALSTGLIVSEGFNQEALTKIFFKEHC